MQSEEETTRHDNGPDPITQSSRALRSRQGTKGISVKPHGQASKRWTRVGVRSVSNTAGFPAPPRERSVSRSRDSPTLRSAPPAATRSSSASASSHHLAGEPAARLFAWRSSLLSSRVREEGGLIVCFSGVLGGEFLFAALQGVGVGGGHGRREEGVRVRGGGRPQRHQGLLAHHRREGFFFLSLSSFSAISVCFVVTNSHQEGIINHSQPILFIGMSPNYQHLR